MADANLPAILDDEARDRIRCVWHDGRLFMSVIDVVGYLTESKTPRQYWYDMKQRITDEGFREVSARCLQKWARKPPVLSRGMNGPLALRSVLSGGIL